MSYQPGPPRSLAYGGFFSPAVAKLRTQLSRETATCWLLISLIAFVIAPMFYGFFAIGLPIGAELLSSLYGPSISSFIPGDLDLFAGFAAVMGSLLGTVGSLLPSILVIVWAVVVNRRSYMLTARDLVWGGVALCLVDEAFSHVIEEAKSQRYRPNPNPVKPGDSFASRLNHFAYYYRQYNRLGYGPNDLKVPMVIQGNCWVEGTAMAVLSCSVVASLLALPLIIRTVLLWPRVLAIKQATIDFLAGKFDSDLERLWQSREVRV